MSSATMDIFPTPPIKITTGKNSNNSRNNDYDNSRGDNDYDSSGDEDVFDLKPTEESISQSEIYVRPRRTLSECSVTSSVMGPPTYRPPEPADDDDRLTKAANNEDVDARIQQVKSKIESEMRERKHLPPPRPQPRLTTTTIVMPMMPPPPLPLSHAPPVPMETDDADPNESSPTKKKPRNDVVLDPASGQVVDIAVLPWHQRFALTHPYFRNMPYVPPQPPFAPGMPMGGGGSFPRPSDASRGGGGPIGSGSFAKGPRPFRRTTPLVRYIPGGFKDLNRQSSTNPVDFSSELMSYVRMRKEMLKMDLREKIRQRKEELLRSQRAVFDNASSLAKRERGKEEYGSSGKYYHYRDSREFRERDSRENKESSDGRDRDSRENRDARDRDTRDAREADRGRQQPKLFEDRGRGPTSPPPPAPAETKTPRQLWQAKLAKQAEQRRNRSSSSSSSSSASSTSSDDERDGRRKWIEQRKATMIAKTALIKEKINKAKSVREADPAAKQRSPSPKRDIKVHATPRTPGNTGGAG